MFTLFNAQYRNHSNKTKMEISYARGGSISSPSQLPSWVRGGLLARGILYRDTDTPQGKRKRWKEEREKLEEELLFIKKQHKETLQQLHSEAERLQRENRELSFRLVMCRCSQQSPNTAAATDRTSDTVQMQQEIERLQLELVAERHRTNKILHNYLQARTEQQIIRKERTCCGFDGVSLENSNIMEGRGHGAQRGRFIGGRTTFPPLKPPQAPGLSGRRGRQVHQRKMSRCTLPSLQPFT